MKFKNKFPLLLLLCVISFALGIFHLVAAVSIFLLIQQHSWSNALVYSYLISDLLLVLPLILFGFSRKAAWSCLSLGVLLFTLGAPIMLLSAGREASDWTAAGLVIVLGVCVLLLLTNRKVTEETEMGSSK